ncbi:nucleotidyltransferase domain-containing protein [Cohaesibacter intestini]|uniref:nucleotidyltransferase domain-containing protein n=1 Tax=Cohaesibacter intestini TaxID=2211145 RepID=UPI000DEBBB13|nr:tRNA nucleotidyltransferase [Cohaesibacter intestini]
MQISDVIGLLHLVERHDITLWIDGGWGIDALLKRQTRPHGDLDIVLETRTLPRLIALLSEEGFQRLETPDSRDWNFVMGDLTGRRVDFHVITLDDRGNGLYGPVSGGQAYPASALEGKGQIGNHPVRCISAAYQVASHEAGYPLRPQDYQDMQALCTAFALPLPDRFLPPQA